MQKRFFIAAALAGLTAVILGAFGAHALKAVLSTEQLSCWEKGVQYQFYHTLAILGCALYLKMDNPRFIRLAAYLFAIGILCFSGSLYLLATRDFTHLPGSVLGPVTPLGGLFFIGGWILVLVEAIQIRNES